MKALALTLLLALSTTAYAADRETGDELYEVCVENLENVENDTFMRFGICRGYILGVIEGFTAAREADGGTPPCIPKAVTNSQKIDAVLEYLEDNPKMRHLAARVLVMVAINDAWPCPEVQQ